MSEMMLVLTQLLWPFLVMGFLSCLALLVAGVSRGPGFGPIPRWAPLVPGLATLVTSWYFMFFLILLLMHGFLVPWDMQGGLRPPKGTWDRELNDFFNAGVGEYLPSWIVPGIDAILLTVKMVRSRNANHRAWLPLLFGVTNVAFLLMMTLSVVLFHDVASLWLPGSDSVRDPGYHRTWPVIAITSSLLLVLYLWQGHATPGFLRPTPLAESPEMGRD
ncbi:MAG: hypothetical protein ACYC5J_15210 [Chloroflexota bacterium]